MASAAVGRIFAIAGMSLCGKIFGTQRPGVSSSAKWRLILKDVANTPGSEYGRCREVLNDIPDCRTVRSYVPCENSRSELAFDSFSWLNADEISFSEW